MFAAHNLLASILMALVMTGAAALLPVPEGARDTVARTATLLLFLLPVILARFAADRRWTTLGAAVSVYLSVGALEIMLLTRGAAHVALSGKRALLLSVMLGVSAVALTVLGVRLQSVRPGRRAASPATPALQDSPPIRSVAPPLPRAESTTLRLQAAGD